MPNDLQIRLRQIKNGFIHMDKEHSTFYPTLDHTIQALSLLITQHFSPKPSRQQDSPAHTEIEAQHPPLEKKG